MKRNKFLFFSFLTLLTAVGPSIANATTLFEGWFDIYLGAKKIGFLTERYEFTPESKFKSTYYLKTNVDGGNITESLKAFASSSLAPLNYAYTSKAGDDVKIVDATFKGEVMTLKIIENKKERKETKKIKKGTFLSTFLLYLIMQDKSGGLKLDNSYLYNAIAEEEGVAYTGQALVSSREKIKGKDTFKILNKFKMGTKNEERFFTWVTPKGEIVLTRSPEKNLDVRIAESQSDATKGFMVSQQDLKLLFGKIPGATGAGDTDATASGSGTTAGAGAGPVTPGNNSAVPQKGLPPKAPADANKAADPAANAPLDTTVTPDEADKLEIKKKKPGPVKGATVPGGEGIEIKGVPPPKGQ